MVWTLPSAKPWIEFALCQSGLPQFCSQKARRLDQRGNILSASTSFGLGQYYAWSGSGRNTPTQLRPAVFGDIDRIYAIRLDASESLLRLGADQWQGPYPGKQDFARDVELGRLFVVDDGDQVIGVMSVGAGPEKNYQQLEGAWIIQDADVPYTVIHRIAVKKEAAGRGVAKRMLAEAEKMAAIAGSRSIRIDTHEKNKPMRGLLLTSGYQLCGAISLLTTDPGRDPYRLAFEKLVEK